MISGADSDNKASTPLCLGLKRRAIPSDMVSLKCEKFFFLFETEFYSYALSSQEKKAEANFKKPQRNFKKSEIVFTKPEIG